jgi:hypothetical protein
VMNRDVWSGCVVCGCVQPTTLLDVQMGGPRCVKELCVLCLGHVYVNGLGRVRMTLCDIGACASTYA